MSGQLATSETILVSAAGVIAADSAGLSSVKSYSALLTSIAAMPLAGGTFTGNVLFTDNTYDIGASGATRPRTVYAGTSVVSPLVNNPSAAITVGNSTHGATVPGPLSITSTSTQLFGIEVYNYGASGTYKYLQIKMGGTSAGNTGWNNAGLVESGGSGGLVLCTLPSSAPILFQIARTTQATLTDTLFAITPPITCAAITASGVVSHGTYTVATLPSAVSNAGKMAQVTDSNVAASGNYGATVAGGGANRVKVFSDGTNWVIA